MKKLIVVGTGMTMAMFLSGCAEGNLMYKDKEMPVSEVEERISDELEVENPNFDLEIQIYEETDD